MNREKLKKILDYLISSSVKRQIAWKLNADNEFQVDFGQSSIIVGYKERNPFEMSIGCEVATGPYLSVINPDGVKILTLDVRNSIKYFDEPNTIGTLYALAKDSVFKFEETFDDILTGLDSEISRKKSSKSEE